MNKLFQSLLLKQASTIIAGMKATLQAEEVALAEQLGEDDARLMVDETEEILRQLDTASSGNLTKIVMRLTAAGAVRSFVQQ
jgi:hypothetical protein